MANTKISQLTALTTPTGGEELVYAYNNANGKMTLNTMKGYVENNLSGYVTDTDLADDLATKQDTLVSGTNIKTINGASILGSGNIDIEGGGGQTSYDYSAMQGPCSSGFHIPSENEWSDLITMGTTIGAFGTGTDFGTYLKLPRGGYRDYSDSNISGGGVQGRYWSSYSYSGDDAGAMRYGTGGISTGNYHKAFGYLLRGFKDEPFAPTPSWIRLYDGSGTAAGAGIFHNAQLGLISISADGEKRVTIADKNVGATTVWNWGDAESETNSGKFFQRGNNYGFDFTGAVTTSSTKVDASAYGPGNYYSSSTFITVSSSPYDWSSVTNDNLWGYETGPIPVTEGIAELTADANIWELSEGTYETEYELYYKTGSSIPFYNPNGGVYKQRITVIEKSGIKGYFAFSFGVRTGIQDCKCSFGYSQTSSDGDVREVKDWGATFKSFTPMTNTQTIDGDLGVWITQVVSGVDTDVQMKVYSNSLHPGVTYTVVVTSVASGYNYSVTLHSSVTNPLNIALPTASNKPCVMTFMATDSSHAVVTGCTMGN